VAAVIDGVDTVTIANVAGSNIANVFVIVGLSTIALGTIRFNKNLIDLDLPLLAGVTALFSLMIIDGALTRVDGVILLIGFVGYIFYSLGYKDGDKEHHKGLLRMVASLSKGSQKKVEAGQNLIGPFTVVILIASIALLAIGSKFAIDSLLRIVEEVDVGVGVLSFFALAIGTSLPELVVSIKALRKGQGDLVVGNIIGSCMFNMLLIGGVASVLKPQVVDMNIVGYVIAGLGLSVFLLTAGSISKRIHIWEGFIYVLIYMTLANKIIGA
jgi:cation:H+ antiporter